MCMYSSRQPLTTSLFYREHAVDYYIQAGNVDKMAESYYILEEYEKLEQLIDRVPENHPLLEVHVYLGLFVCI